MASANPQMIYFEVTGEKDVALEMRGIGARAMDAAPVLEVVANMLGEYEAAQFRSEGFGSWPALAPSTLASKARKGYPPRILYATGVLEESLVGDATTYAVRRVTPDELVYGTSLPYAQYHAHGTSKMPQRNPVKVEDPIMRGITKTIQRYIVGLERAEFGNMSGPTSLDPFGLGGG